MDRVLHTERAVPRRFGQRRYVAQSRDLPDGAILLDGVPKMVRGDGLLPVNADGYGPREPRRDKPVTVLTPPTSLRALAAGYLPELHRSVLDC